MSEQRTKEQAIADAKRLNQKLKDMAQAKAEAKASAARERKGSIQ